MTNNDAYWYTQNHIHGQNQTIQDWINHANKLERNIKTLKQDINTLNNRVQERDEFIETLKKSVKKHEADLDEAATVIGKLNEKVEDYKISQEIDQEVKRDLRVELSMYIESAKRVSFVRLLDDVILENEDAARSVLAGN